MMIQMTEKKEMYTNLFKRQTCIKQSILEKFKSGCIPYLLCLLLTSTVKYEEKHNT